MAKGHDTGLARVRRFISPTSSDAKQLFHSPAESSLNGLDSRGLSRGIVAATVRLQEGTSSISVA